MNSPLLFLSPAPPDGQDSGLRIRARHSLCGLRSHQRVHAFHFHPGWKWNRSGLPWFPVSDPGLVWRRLRHLFGCNTITEDRCFSRLAQLQLLALARIYRYRRIHLFRAAMIPLASPLLEIPGMRVQLDLDEIESDTRCRLAELADLRGEPGAARRYRREAAYFAKLEKQWMPRFERVFLSSELECGRLRRQYPGLAIQVLPNLPRALPLTPPSVPPAAAGLLFVGNLDYYPNRDAVEWLLQEILPRLGSRAQLQIAGSGSWRPPPLPGVVDLGRPADLGPVYARSLVALAPLRAGGGTRIKALEAFAHARAVVGTPLGLEGLEVRAGDQVFVAEHPDLFAQHCLRLLEDRELAQAAGVRAYDWVRRLPVASDWSQILA